MDPNRAARRQTGRGGRRAPANLPVEEANLVRLLVQEGDFALLPQVIAALAQTGKERGGPTKADIISAVELTPEEQSAACAPCSQKNMVMASSSPLRWTRRSWGLGPRVRVGDKLIDTSLASRLARLRNRSHPSCVRGVR